MNGLKLWCTDSRVVRGIAIGLTLAFLLLAEAFPRVALGQVMEDADGKYLVTQVVCRRVEHFVDVFTTPLGEDGKERSGKAVAKTLTGECLVLKVPLAIYVEREVGSTVIPGFYSPTGDAARVTFFEVAYKAGEPRGPPWFIHLAVPWYGHGS